MVDHISQFPPRSEMMMPVTDDHAARLIEIEAFRQITDNLKRLNENVLESTKALHTIDLRLTRIESNSVNTKVTELERKVDTLESERDKRIGAASLAAWVFKNWPGVLGFIGLVLLILQTTGKLK